MSARIRSLAAASSSSPCSSGFLSRARAQSLSQRAARAALVISVWVGPNPSAAAGDHTSQAPACGLIHRQLPSCHSGDARGTARAGVSLVEAQSQWFRSLPPERHRDSVGVSSLRRGDATVFFDDYTLTLSDEGTRAVLQDVIEDESLPALAYALCLVIDLTFGRPKV